MNSFPDFKAEIFKVLKKIKVVKPPSIVVLENGFFIHGNVRKFTCFWTDGSALWNLPGYPAAGFGVFISQGHPNNVSDPVKNWDAVTNDSAELRAIVTVLEIAAQHGIKNIFIVTDSDFAVDSITKLDKLATWIRCGWQGLNNSKLELKNLYEEFICKIEPIEQLKFAVVKSHQKDQHNNAADELAGYGSIKFQIQNGQEIGSFLHPSCRFNPIEMQIIDANTPMRAPPPHPWVIFPPRHVVRQITYEDEPAEVPE